MYDKNGKITRAGAEQAIREGGSVLLGGTLYTRIDMLPDEAAFATGDSAAEQQARDNLLRQRQAIDDQLARLGNPPPPAMAQARQPARQEQPPPDDGKPKGGK